MSDDTNPPARRLEYLPLRGLVDADVNPKSHDTDGIARSITTHGFTEPPLLDERTGRLVAGHGRLDDLRARKGGGGNPPAGVQVDADTGDWLVPVVRGWSSTDDAHAAAYLAASNKLTEAGGWDPALLPGFLSELDNVGLLPLTGFSDDELAKMLAGPDHDEWADALDGHGDGEKTHASRTFNLRTEQADIVDRAIEMAQAYTADDGGNRNADALVYICSAFIREHT